jgi:hypothetical protein
MRYVKLPERQFYPQASYGALFADLHAKGIQDIVVADGGIVTAGFNGYAPQMRFYELVWQERGLRITRALSLANSDRQRAIASCDPTIARALIAEGGLEFGAKGCGVLPGTRVRASLPRNI